MNTIPVRPQPAPTFSEPCKRCISTGLKRFVSRKTGKVTYGTCFNCEGLGWLTPSQTVELAKNAACGKRHPSLIAVPTPGDF